MQPDALFTLTRDSSPWEEGREENTMLELHRYDSVVTTPGL
jgi:hypothetical protein